MKRIKFGEIEISNLSKRHIADCLETNHVTMGPKVSLLETRWSNLFDYKHTIAVSSGTSACIAANLSLYEFGAKPGDQVIVPALSFIATANAVRAAGFTPVFCDVKPDLLIDESIIEDLITPRTVAIMPVSLMGKPPRMDIIRDLANKHSLTLILDSCEGTGCKFDGLFMSHWADVVVYSCYAAHLLFSGEMGFVCTNCNVIANAAESVRSHGRKPGSLYFDHQRFGLNLKPTDLHASLGLGNIEHFWDIFNNRKANWLYLKENISLPNHWLSDEDERALTSPHAFSIVGKVDELKKRFDDANIEWKRNFGSMPTQHACFSYLGYQLGDFPVAEYIGDNGIHVGVHNHLTQEDLERMVGATEGL